MNFKVIKPSWEYRADGALALKDAGVALLEFAPAQQGSGTAPGERRYDWENKTVQNKVYSESRDVADEWFTAAPTACGSSCRTSL